jgi:hypothetical protein
MFKNQLFDLVFESMIPLAGYNPACDLPPDVTVRYGDVIPCPLLQTDFGLSYLVEANRCILSWPDTDAYQIDDGCRITVQPFFNTPESEIILSLLGLVSALLLMQRGIFSLHGSAVVVNNKAFIFIGEKGQGKSTMASQMVAAGATLLTDDLAAIDIKDTGNFVRPGFPDIKLWPDSLLHLDENPNHHPRIIPEVEKRNLSLPNRFHPHVTQIASIFLLNIGDDLSLQRLNFQESFLALTSNASCRHFTEKIPTPITTTRFQQCAQLAKTTPIYSLTRPHDFTRIPEIISLLLSDTVGASSL